MRSKNRLPLMFRALLLLLYFTCVTSVKMSRFLRVGYELKYNNLITKLKRLFYYFLFLLFTIKSCIRRVRIHN